ncbi:MAG TPA: hypothetical protein VGK24_09685 [Candidatus Angelobacter sp.]|jgi:hypothetical protein
MIWMIFGGAVLFAVMSASAQMTENAAREQARNTVRSQLHLKPEQFLDIQRDEGLERLLASVVSRPAWSEFIYKVSQAGDEIKKNVVIHHIFTDVDPTYIVAISPADGSTYRIHGFGIAESLAGFEKLMAALKVRVSNSEQAESVTDFYRSVNPENHEGLTPISSLLELKQAAERQCQSLGSFDAGQSAFNLWWDRAKSLYEDIPFVETASPHGSDYRVDWIVLSSPSGENCGGVPLQAQLEISSDGHAGKLTFSPLQKPTKPSH